MLCLRPQITSHLLLFTDAVSGAEVGTVTLYLEPATMAYLLLCLLRPELLSAAI